MDNTHRSRENLLRQCEVEKLIYRAQMLATQHEPQDSPIIEMMNNLKLMSQLENTDFSLHKQIDRGLRFLGAFADELPDFRTAEKNISALCDGGNEGFNINLDDEADLPEAFLNRQTTAYIDARNNEPAVRNDASNDAHALQAYLQAISAAATAPNTRVLIGRLDKLSEYEPDLALQRIGPPALTNESVSLVAVEVDRRLDAVFRTIEKLEKNVSRAALLKDTLFLERGRLKKAFESYDDIANCREAWNGMQQDNDKKFNETSIPQVILQKV